MSTYAGALTDTPTGIGATGRQAAYAYMDFSQTPVVTSIAMAATGAREDHQPGVAYPRSWVGMLESAYSDDFYHRIHLFPPEIKLGNVLSAQKHTIRLWNAYFYPVSYSALRTRGNSGGITISEPIIPPATMPGLEEYVYPLHVSPQGPGQIAVDLVWTIEGADYQVRISGRRMIAFPFEANWRDGIRETLEWLTTVNRAEATGKEQRAGLRSKPRRQLEVTHQALGDVARGIEAHLIGWHGRQFGIPVWTDQTVTLGVATAGDRVIPVDTTGLGFAEGDIGLIWHDYQTFEVFEIELVSQSAVATTLPLQQNWRTGANIAPAALATLPPSQQITHHTDDILEAQLSWACDTVNYSAHIPVAAAALTYGGVELCLRPANWAVPRQVILNGVFDIVDNRIGTVSRAWPTGVSSTALPASWILNGRSEINDFRAWLGRRKGQLVPCWMPSGHQDFRLWSAIGAGDATIVVADNGWEALMKDNPAYGHVIVLAADGAHYPRAILDISDNEDGTLNINLDAALGVELAVDDVDRISYLALCRLGGDQLVLTWHAQQVVTFDTTLQVIVP